MQDFYTLIEIIVIFAVGYYVGTITTVMKMLDIFKEIMGRELDPEEIIIEEDIEPRRVQLFVTENINDTLYLYNKDKFICQGTTLEELCKRCMEYTKLNEVFIYHNEQAYHYDGEVIEKIQNEG